MNNITVTTNLILRITLISITLLLGVVATQAQVNSTADPGDGICDVSECTLREAITAANAEPGFEEISFKVWVTGTINLTGPLPDITDALQITGPGRDKLTVRRDSGGDYGIFTVNGVDFTVTGLTISNGSGETGSGIRKIGASLLEIRNVTISGNSANAGGGINSNDCYFSTPGQITITNSTISNNNSTNEGGGICAPDTVTISNSTISGNSISRYGGGGGISSHGSLAISNSTISGNSVTAGIGGGIFSDGSSLTISNSTISANAAQFAGGIYNSGLATISLSTITANSPYGIVNDRTVNLQSSIVDLNSFRDLRGQIDSLGYNVVGSTVGAVFFPAVGDQVGITADQLKLGPLQDNGGPTMTHALLPESVAIDRGINSEALTTDQRGLPRTVDDTLVANSSDGTDVGAYEAPTAAPFSDLLLGLAADKTSVKQGDLLTYTITIKNFGPHYATNTVVNNFISSGATLYSVHANKGHFTAPPTGQTGTVTWYLDTLLDGDQQSAQLQVTVIIKGKTTITNTASVASDVPDPNMANNSASLTTSVASGGGGSKK
jgi:uncharacterized repeat protein (TIGR01451 family)/CSLREA domain-containing protein